MTLSNAIPSQHTAARPAPIRRRTAARWFQENFFSSPFNTLMTMASLWFLAVTLPGALRWAVLEAVWLPAEADVCKAAAGACLAVLWEKHRVMLFGTFPYDQHWRGLMVILLITGMGLLSMLRRLWSWWLMLAWFVTAAVVFTLLTGGVFGLRPVGSHEWGGLPLTLVMFTITVVAGIPLGIVLALGRRSEMPAIRALCVGVIELVRGLPLVTVLFMASLMLPLFMPAGVTIDKFIRAQIAMTLFFSTYAAEVVRGGLQAVPRGQYEAAATVGLSWLQTTTRIILPQALRIALPSMINEIIRAFKNTTFIGIIGLFDVLRATSTALQDPVWVQFSIEAYLAVFLLYFLICSGMSRYGARIERDTDVTAR